jgi:hypothetical protein
MVFEQILMFWPIVRRATAAATAASPIKEDMYLNLKTHSG